MDFRVCDPHNIVVTVATCVALHAHCSGSKNQNAMPTRVSELQPAAAMLRCACIRGLRIVIVAARLQSQHRVRERAHLIACKVLRSSSGAGVAMLCLAVSRTCPQQ